MIPRIPAGTPSPELCYRTDQVVNHGMEWMIPRELLEGRREVHRGSGSCMRQHAGIHLGTGLKNSIHELDGTRVCVCVCSFPFVDDMGRWEEGREGRLGRGVTILPKQTDRLGTGET